jgi:probable phosphoglycerate mutase
MGDLVVLRHGETEWSAQGRHTGTTDIPLTPRGEQQARDVGALLRDRKPVLVLSSPLKRARETARLAGFPIDSDDQLDPDLVEWDYGAYEGITTPEIREVRPGWYLWTDGVPPGEDHPGEDAAAVGARVDRVLARVRPALEHGDVLLIGHGHTLRVLIARYLGLAPEQGGLFLLGTAGHAILTQEHGRPALGELV